MSLIGFELYFKFEFWYNGTIIKHPEIQFVTRSGSRNFGKGGPVRGRSPEPSAEGTSAGEGPPQKILKN